MHCIVKATDLGVLEPAAKNEFPQETISQFRKTADLVSREPWSLLEAQDYLLRLIEENGKPGKAVHLPMLQYQKVSQQTLPTHGGNWENRQPRNITVNTVTGHEKARRMGLKTEAKVKAKAKGVKTEAKVKAKAKPKAKVKAKAQRKAKGKGKAKPNAETEADLVPGSQIEPNGTDPKDKAEADLEAEGKEDKKRARDAHEDDGAKDLVNGGDDRLPAFPLRSACFVWIYVMHILIDLLTGADICLIGDSVLPVRWQSRARYITKPMSCGSQNPKLKGKAKAKAKTEAKGADQLQSGISVLTHS